MPPTRCSASSAWTRRISPRVSATTRPRRISSIAARSPAARRSTSRRRSSAPTRSGSISSTRSIGAATRRCWRPPSRCSCTSTASKAAPVRHATTSRRACAASPRCRRRCRDRTLSAAAWRFPRPRSETMQFGLTAEQELVVDTVHSFAELGREIQRKVIELGFYAPNIPAAFGGGGLDQLTFALLERELGRAAMALSVGWGRPSNILCACNDEQRQRYLLPSVRGEKIDALAMTEPDAGSDVRGMKCSARRDGADWVINGSKHFISHADIADFVIVFVATGEEATAGVTKKRITCFLVDRGTPGFEIRHGYNSVSHRGYHNCILAFNDCRLPAGQMLGEEGQGFV